MKTNAKVQNMRASNLLPVCIFTLCAFLSGQDAGTAVGAASRPESGMVIRGIYTNAFFGFSLRLPDGWEDNDQSRKEDLASDLATPVVNPKDEAEHKATAEVSQRTHLLVLTKPAPVTQGFLEITAEDLSPFPQIKTPAQYLAEMAERLKDAPGVKVLAEPYETKIAGRSFARIDLKGTLYESCLATIAQANAINFCMNSNRAEELDHQMEVFDKLRFFEAVTVPGAVMREQAISRAEPIAPPLAKMAGIGGAVKLNALINQEGRVTYLDVLDGHPMLAAAAIAAAQEWRYRPYTVNGSAKDVRTIITVTFKAM